MASLPQTQPQASRAPLTRSTGERLASRVYAINWEVLAYLVIFGLALFTRFYDLGARAMSHDESLHTQHAWQLATQGYYAHDPMMHGPLLFHATAFSYFVFGADDFTSRIYPALLGVAIVLMPLLFRRWIGRWPALLASVMLLVSPYMTYYSRYIRHDIPVIFFALLMAWAAFKYLEDETRRPLWLYLVAACLLLMLASKEVAFIYAAIIGGFFLLVLAAEVARRRWPHVDARLVFNTIVIGLILGAALAMGLIVVVAIIPQSLWDQGSYLFRLVGWVLIVGLVVLGVLFTTAAGQFRRRRFHGFPARVIVAIVVITLVVASVGLIFEEASHVGEDEGEQTLTSEMLGVDASWDEIYNRHGGLVWAALIAVVAAGGLVVFTRLMGWWRPLLEQPAFGVLVVIGTLVLPWLTPLLVKAQGYNPTLYEDFWPILLTWLPIFLITVMVGFAWNWRWGIVAFIFYALFLLLFTTLFTNGRGLATGMIGSLGYWLGQQGVRRGSQPQYYYVLQMLFYEFLPLVGAIGAGLLGLNGFFRRRRIEAEARDAQALEADAAAEEAPIARETGAPFVSMPHLVLTFFGFLAAANFVGYTLAGEKMPWLTTHLTTPMIFVAAWFFAQVIAGIKADRFLQVGWTLLILLPMLFIAALRVFAPLFDPSLLPFQGLQRDQLTLTGQWLAFVLVFAGAGYGVVKATRLRVGGRQLARLVGVVAFAALLVLTVRAAWLASFVNYDLATEFMVYAHSSPAVTDAVARIEEMSFKLTDSRDLVVAYDYDIAWPLKWYLRDYTDTRPTGDAPTVEQLADAQVVLIHKNKRDAYDPLLEDQFYSYDFTRMWWPIQDYYHLTPQQIDHLFALNQAGADLRQGLFDIWLHRDYSAYARAIGRDPGAYSLASWPGADWMTLYLRRDLAAQVFPVGFGESEALTTSFEDPYAANALLLPAVSILDEDIGLAGPRGLALDGDGNLYIADALNHRIVALDPAGKIRLTLGSASTTVEELAPPGTFSEPWGVAVAEDGTIFVADTWNHRVQAFTAAGEFITMWGYRDINASADPEAFFGPRNLAVLGDELYVVDTGNKRIRVYRWDGKEATWTRDIGAGGSEPGQFQEPVGLGIDLDDNLIVADTWNRRVQVLSAEGEYRLHWPVSAWYQTASGGTSSNLPYLETDDRGNIYVADPDTCRLLVFSKDGSYRYSFGRCVDEPIALTDFGSLSGVVMDESYQLYVADPIADRILVFDLAIEPAIVPATE
jgi:predicted membrane-bound mannosyltransferase/sugar lactone lactonase YvrE